MPWRRQGLRGIVLSLLILGLVGAVPFAGMPTPAAADSGETFSPKLAPSSPCDQQYTVPQGVYLVQVVAIGGSGQAGADFSDGALVNNGGGRGGHGAQVTALVPVQPGETLDVAVAHNGDGGPQGDAFAGWPTGGDLTQNNSGGTTSVVGHGGGGGSSFIVRDDDGSCTYSPSTYLVVAGGGGGGGGGDAGVNADGSGGNGGNGGGGGCGYGNGGIGATVTGPGNGGAGGCIGHSGDNGFGSNGGGIENADSDGNGDGGAGGGGWYGGGAGGTGIVSGGGGGAGSSAVGPEVKLLSLATTSSGPQVTITPVATSLPDSLFAVAAGNGFTCALTPSQAVTCWGDNTHGQSTPPSGTFTSLSAGDDVACGVKTDQTIACWGDSIYGQTTVPAGQFHQVSVGGGFVCGLRVDSTITCWGTIAPYVSTPGLYRSISSGENYVCAINLIDQHPSCFSNTNTVPDTTPAGDQFTQIAAGMFAPCGLLTDGTSVCWGGSYAPTPPSGTFSAIAGGSSSGDMCWIASDGTLQCATTGYGWTLPPPNGALIGDADPVRLGVSFSAVSMGYNHACGVRTIGNYFWCWGNDDDSKGEIYPIVPSGQPDPYEPAVPDPYNAVLPPATVGQPYSHQFTSTYESPAPTFSLQLGVPGLTLDPNTGLLSGTPTTPGQYSFGVDASNGVTPGFGACTTGYTDSCLLVQLTVTDPAPTTSSLSPASVRAGGAAVVLTVAGSGFVPSSQVVLTTAGGTSTTLTPSSVASDGSRLTVTIPATTIARAGTLRVTVVNAAPGGGTSNVQPLFVTTTGAAVASTSSSTGGTASTGGSGPNSAGSVTVSGSGGSGTVAVALYSANPGTTPSFAASSAYFDAYVAPGSTYSSVQITDCDLTAGSVALWYNAATATWVQASSQSYNATTHCTTITVSATTTPSLAQLGGTPFAIADNPLLSLDEQGLPGSVAHQATLDGQTVSLPDSKVAVPYNSRHSYSFPALVIDNSSGTAYFTGDPGFSGAVTANRTDTAVYQTMAQAVAAALASGGINDGGVATALTQQFNAVQADIAAHNTGQALADLHTFASHVRAQSGQHISATTAKSLLADAQLVYASLGGTGSV
jgi:hypothetical protein